MVDVDVGQLIRACDMYQHYIGELITQVNTLDPSIARDNRVQTALINAKTKLIHICESPILFETLAELNRPKRSIAVAGIAILASTGLGIYNTVQLNKLTATTYNISSDIVELKRQILTLTRLTSRLFSMEEDLKTAYREITVLIDHIKVRVSTRTDVLMSISHFNYCVSILHDFVSNFETGFQHLQNQKLSLDIISPTKLIDLWQDIRARTTPDMELLFPHPFDLLQLPASYTFLPDNTLRVILHVPLAATKLTLFKHVPFPVVPADVDMPIIVRSRNDKHFLAISEDHRLHRQLSVSDLEEGCYNFRNNYICDDMSFFHSLPSATCLGSLYAGLQDGVDTLCEVVVFNNRFAAHNIARNKLLLFATEFTAYKLKCPNANPPLQARQFIGYEEVSMHPTCRIDSSEFHIQGTAMSLLKSTVSFNLTMKFTSLGRGTSTKEVDFLNNNLAKLTLKPEANVEDILDQVHLMMNTVTYFPHMETNVVIIIIIVLSLFTLCLVCGCARSLKAQIRQRIRGLVEALQLFTQAQAQLPPGLPNIPNGGPPPNNG